MTNNQSIHNKIKFSNLMNPLILTKNNLYYLQLIIAIPKRITTILIVTVTTIVAAKENNSFMISLT